MIPNSVVLSAAIGPLREPDSINVKVRLGAEISPSHVQAISTSRWAPRRAPSRACYSKRSTAKTSSSASRPRPSAPTTVLGWRTKSSQRWQPSPPRTRGTPVNRCARAGSWRPEPHGGLSVLDLARRDGLPQLAPRARGKGSNGGRELGQAANAVPTRRPAGTELIASGDASSSRARMEARRQHESPRTRPR